VKLPALLLLALAQAAVAQEPKLPCAYGDKECARKVLAAHPAKTLAFWGEAFAKPVDERLGAAPAELIEILALDNIANNFPNRPRSPRLDPEFMADVRAAMAGIPEVVKKRLASKLAGIYFIDDIGGTGFTDNIYGADRQPVAGFVVLDPTVLAKQTANGWATWKERSPFKPDPSLSLEARIETGSLDNRAQAIQYILLHELGHVLAIGEGLHPNWNLATRNVGAMDQFRFSRLSWRMSDGRFASVFDDTFPQRQNVVFYFGAKLDGRDMMKTYESLERTNFATLYAATHPADDFAESFANFVHVVVMGKPFDIRFSSDGRVVKTYRDCWDEERCAAKRGILEDFLR
jgi:hypothetical protein